MCIRDRKGSTELGASSILQMLKQDNFDTFIFNELNGLNNGDGSRMTNIMNIGLPIVRSLLGDKIDEIIQWLSDKNELSQSSVSSLLSLGTPFIMGIIGREAKSKHLNDEGLSHLLIDQSPFVKSLIPPGLASITNFTALNNPPLFTESSTIAYDPTPKIVPSKPNSPSGGGLLGNFLPWLILLLGIAMLWYFMRGCNTVSKEKTEENTELTLDSAGQEISDAVDTIKAGAEDVAATIKGKVDELGNWISNLGKDYTVTLPNGKELKVYEGSVERNLVDLSLIHISEPTRPY